MRQLFVLYQKELLEMWRNKKLVWVPIVFILLGLSQPITAYYQPEILKLAGLSDEAIKQLPQPNAMEVIAETLSQFNLLGALILVLAGMSLISGERQSGVAAMIFVKPVSYFRYILAKWISYLTLTVLSITLGLIASAYYTNQLIGTIDYDHVFLALPLYLLWFIFIITITILLGTMLDGASSIAFVSLLIVSILSIVTGAISKYMEWSPAQLSAFASEIIIMGKTSEATMLSLTSTLVLIIIFIYLSIISYKQKPLMK